MSSFEAHSQPAAAFLLVGTAAAADVDLVTWG